MDDMASIDAPAVRAMGEAVNGIGEHLVAVAAGIAEWEYEHRGAVEGAVTTEHWLAGAARAWRNTTEELGLLVREFGYDLRAAAGDFVTVDQAVADRVRSTSRPGE